MLEIKPCPFCGTSAGLYFSLGKAFIECNNKKCYIKPSTWSRVEENKVDKLVKKWNIRMG